MTLGYAKHLEQSLEQFANNLSQTRTPVFEELFDLSWNVLQDNAKQVLLVALIYSNGASADALKFTADLNDLEFGIALRQLIDLSLITEEISTSATRYAIHPIIRELAETYFDQQSILI